jgi:hypothetical protein
MLLLTPASHGTFIRWLKPKPTACRDQHAERRKAFSGDHDQPIAFLICRTEQGSHRGGHDIREQVGNHGDQHAAPAEL